MSSLAMLSSSALSSSASAGGETEALRAAAPACDASGGAAVGEQPPEGLPSPAKDARLDGPAGDENAERPLVGEDLPLRKGLRGQVRGSAPDKRGAAVTTEKRSEAGGAERAAKAPSGTLWPGIEPRDSPRGSLGRGSCAAAEFWGEKTHSTDSARSIQADGEVAAFITTS